MTVGTGEPSRERGSRNGIDKKYVIFVLYTAYMLEVLHTLLAMLYTKYHATHCIYIFSMRLEEECSPGVHKAVGSFPGQIIPITFTNILYAPRPCYGYLLRNLLFL